MTEIQIRQAVVEDAHTLFLAEQYWAQFPGHLVSQPHELKSEKFAQKIEALSSGEGLYVVGVRDQQIVGHAFLEPMGLENISHSYRFTIVVHPERTSQGVGKELMTHLITWAKANPKVLKIELLVRSTNERAISLYTKMGFVEEGRFKNRIRVLETEFIDDVAMGLWLE